MALDVTDILVSDGVLKEKILLNFLDLLGMRLTELEIKFRLYPEWLDAVVLLNQYLRSFNSFFTSQWIM